MAVRMLGPQVQYFRKTAQAPTMTTSQNFLSFQFRGKSYTIALDPVSATCSDLLDALQQAIPGLAAETLKVLVSKPKAHSVQLTQQLDQFVSHAGITPGSRCMLLGSYISELQALQDNKKAEASLRLADFDHEVQRVRLRSSNRPGHNTAPQGVHHFGGFQVLPLPPAAAGGVPPPAAALSLLHQLAADPAVVHVMNKHHWKVGLLSEMAAAGRVGVSAVCVLGYNVNHGQEISLRLRTDDYRGFRKYLRIRETLMHELAHMVYSEHDNNFKALNSQLLREVAEFESAAAAARGGRTLAGEGVFDHKDHWLGGQQQQGVAAAAAAAAVSQGRTLGGTSAAAGSSLRAARHAAAAAALARWQQQQPSQVSERESESHEAAAAAAANSDPIPADVLDEVMQQADDGEQSITGAGAGAGAWCLDDSLSDDPATAAAEEEMRRLGSMNIQQQQQHVLQDDGLQAEADNQQQQQQWQHEQHSTLHEGMRQQQQEQHQQHVVADPGMDAVASDVSTHEAAIRSQHQSEQQTKRGETANSSTAAAVSTNPEGIVVVDDVVVTEKLLQAQTYLQQLQQQAGNSSTAALQAVEGVLDSIVQYPGEAKYRRLRCSNAAYQRRIGQYAAAVQLLTLAGFSQQQQEWVATAGPEAVMVYVRDDPGLLWLVLSVVREQLHHQQ